MNIIQMENKFDFKSIIHENEIILILPSGTISSIKEKSWILSRWRRLFNNDFNELRNELNYFNN